jgi:hypothetical protein
MTFIGFTDGIKGWKCMRNTNTIFLATKAVFDENTFPRCPDDSRANIPAIESVIHLSCAQWWTTNRKMCVNNLEGFQWQ